MLTMSDPDGAGLMGGGDGEGLLRPPPGHSAVGRMDSTKASTGSVSTVRKSRPARLSMSSTLTR